MVRVGERETETVREREREAEMMREPEMVSETEMVTETEMVRKLRGETEISEGRWRYRDKQ
jgi:hypothetical protein